LAKQITKRAVDALKPGELLKDGKVAGFACRCLPSGLKVYVLRYRAVGRQRWFTIGKHGSPWTPETARKEALKLLGRVVHGEDPVAKRIALKGAETVRELCEIYLKAAEAGQLLTKAKQPKKLSTLATDRGRIHRHIVPLLGRHRVHNVTRADIEGFLHDVAAGKTKADVKTKPRGRATDRSLLQQNLPITDI
jgi:hypothetical protein